jgi:Flp pilus assembly protein TadD
MGLWVMGKSWVRYVEEIEGDLAEEILNAPTPEYLLLQGLLGLVSGRAGLAEHAFLSAQQKAPQDPLPFLGLGTAAVMDGNDELAKTYYRQTLQVDPENKTAKKNLKVLEEE